MLTSDCLFSLISARTKFVLNPCLNTRKRLDGETAQNVSTTLPTGHITFCWEGGCLALKANPIERWGRKYSDSPIPTELKRFFNNGIDSGHVRVFNRQKGGAT